MWRASYLTPDSPSGPEGQSPSCKYCTSATKGTELKRPALPKTGLCPILPFHNWSASRPGSEADHPQECTCVLLRDCHTGSSRSASDATLGPEVKECLALFVQFLYYLSACVFCCKDEFITGSTPRDIHKLGKVSAAVQLQEKIEATRCLKICTLSPL